MRILFVTPYFVPAWSFGGPVKLVYELARNLQRAGHQVTVATTDVLDRHQRYNQKETEIDGITVKYFPNASNYLASYQNAYLPKGFGSWCKRHLHEYDVIHCHDLFTWLNVVVSRIAPTQGVPFIVQPHGALNTTRIHARLYFIKKMFLKIFPSVLEKASAIITSTDQEKDVEIGNLNKNFLDKTSVIPNGLELQQLRAHRLNSQLRSEFLIGNDELMILYFGRLHYIKGIDISLRALALLKDFSYRFLIVGSDSGALAQLQELTAQLGLGQKVIFRAGIFGDRMADILTTADVFLFNSRSEGLPMSVLDAAAAGLPSIISPGANVPEVGRSGAGIVLSKNTPEATAQALRSFASDKSAQTKMQLQAHEMIRQFFGLEKITLKYLAIYQVIRSSV